jgi:hypothetical protein
MQFESMGYLSHDKHWKNYCLQIGAEPKAKFTITDATCPVNKFALRNILNGKIIDYIPITNESPNTIAGVLQMFYERVKQEEEATNTTLNYELVWCGK